MNDVVWYSPQEAPFHIAGFAWLREEGVYRRLPLTPEHALPPAVDHLANHTAGGQIRFQTDSSRLAVKVRLRGKADMNHMPATGQCGFDCYLGREDKLFYYNTTTFNHLQDAYEFTMFEGMHAGLQNVTLYFPLYQGVEEVLIGLDPDAAVLPPPPYATDRRVVIYGTSITQGGCAARPGMAYPNILSRSLNAEFINLGFSGSGKGEAEVAHAVAAVERPGLLVLDYEANSVSAELLAATLPEFIRIYRAKHPKVPIVVLSQIRYAREIFHPDQLQYRLTRKQVQIDVVNRLREAGDDRLYFYDGERLLGEDFQECTVDGIHPTDLGFQRMAERLLPVLREHLPIAVG